MSLVYVMVTGSREWPKRWLGSVRADLDAQRARLHPDCTLVVIHGACRNGPDMVAHAWVGHHRNHGDPHLAKVDELVFPADGTGPCIDRCDHGPRRVGKGGASYCPAAYQYRNEAMADKAAELGCRVGLAYCLNDSNGTDRTIELMRSRRINVNAKYVYVDPGSEGGLAKSP